MSGEGGGTGTVVVVVEVVDVASDVVVVVATGAAVVVVDGTTCAVARRVPDANNPAATSPASAILGRAPPGAFAMRMGHCHDGASGPDPS